MKIVSIKKLPYILLVIKLRSTFLQLRFSLHHLLHIKFCEILYFTATNVMHPNQNILPYHNHVDPIYVSTFFNVCANRGFYDRDRDCSGRKRKKWIDFLRRIQPLGNRKVRFYSRIETNIHWAWNHLVIQKCPKSKRTLLKSSNERSHDAIQAGFFWVSVQAWCCQSSFLKAQLSPHIIQATIRLRQH